MDWGIGVMRSGRPDIMSVKEVEEVEKVEEGGGK